MRRTFTLAELAALLDGDAGLEPDPRARIAQAANLRGTVRLREADDVPDPINASAAVHAAVAAQIVQLVDRIVPRLAA